MPKLQTIRGAIFDVDETLLDNGPADQPAQWLHSRSRLAAVQEIGKRHSIAALQSLTAEENGVAFTNAKVHSLAGAVWNIFQTKGIVSPTDDEIDLDNPLLQEVVKRKNELHEDILRAYGKELPGATTFVRHLAEQGLANRLALASSAVRRDIDIFLDMYDLTNLFPEERIISVEKFTRPKPDKQAFELAFKSLNLPDNQRSEVLAFEDDPRGILSAKAAGLFTCAITTRYKRDHPQLLAAKPDIVADSYAEFTKLLG